MRVNIRLLDANGELLRYIPRRQAYQLIADGVADSADPNNHKDIHRGVRLLPMVQRVNPNSWTLYLTGVLKHVSYVQGGLCRTETKPFDLFKKLRVEPH